LLPIAGNKKEKVLWGRGCFHKTASSWGRESKGGSWGGVNPLLRTGGVGAEAKGNLGGQNTTVGNVSGLEKVGGYKTIQGAG